MRRLPRPSTLATLGAIALFLVFLLVFNQNADFIKPADYPDGISYEKAVVVEVLEDTIQQDPEFADISIGRQEVVLRITSGAHKGRLLQTYNLAERIINNPASVGTKYLISSYDDFTTATIVDYNREGVLYGLLGLFALAVVLLGRKKGLASLLALAFTLVCIVFLFIPLVLKGVSPVWAAVLVVALSAAVSLWGINGWCTKTLAALASCFGCTLLAGLLSWGAGRLARIDTMNTPEAEELLFVVNGMGLSVRQLLFAGILFASLGAIMDTAMSVTSSIFEIREIDPAATRGQLMKSGMNIGRDIMGTMTNTLILAFTGSSVNLILIYYLYDMPGMRLLNMQLVVVEVIRGLSASTAVVLSIPVAVLVAAAVCTVRPITIHQKGRAPAAKPGAAPQKKSRKAAI